MRLLLFIAITVSVSAYSDVGYTASGAWTEHGIVACGPSYPFGTIFIIQGEPYVCMDRGGLVTDGHVDKWMSSESDAWEHGRQEVTVFVWGMDGPECLR
jgi:3D (Asp-Asp-Asp) domain-containing protein